MTSDVILTLSLLLSAALAARFVASLVRVPEILVLVLFGALLRPLRPHPPRGQSGERRRGDSVKA